MDLAASEDLDVIIVGAGNAATCAALSAHESGARVLMLEIAPEEARGGNSALIADGKRLFEQGVPARGIPPCASCHGAHAEGMAVFPRLAGQHAPYLLKQLLVIQSVLRTAPVMHGVIKDLTKDQMQAVVAYLESI